MNGKLQRHINVRLPVSCFKTATETLQTTATTDIARVTFASGKTRNYHLSVYWNCGLKEALKSGFHHCVVLSTAHGVLSINSLKQV
jgi:hypothetical protein